jgi:hypothetical protein
MRRRTLSEHVISWVEEYCIVPSGVNRGQRVRLTQEQRQTIREIYDHPGGLQVTHVTGQLAAFLALEHIAGPLALGEGPAPDLDADPWTMWSATGPELKEVLKREPDCVRCPELGTQYPAKAA